MSTRYRGNGDKESQCRLSSRSEQIVPGFGRMLLPSRRKVPPGLSADCETFSSCGPPIWIRLEPEPTSLKRFSAMYRRLSSLRLHEPNNLDIYRRLSRLPAVSGLRQLRRLDSLRYVTRA